MTFQEREGLRIPRSEGEVAVESGGQEASEGLVGAGPESSRRRLAGAVAGGLVGALALYLVREQTPFYSMKATAHPGAPLVAGCLLGVVLACLRSAAGMHSREDLGRVAWGAALLGFLALWVLEVTAGSTDRFFRVFLLRAFGPGLLLLVAASAAVSWLRRRSPGRSWSFRRGLDLAELLVPGAVLAGSLMVHSYLVAALRGVELAVRFPRHPTARSRWKFPRESPDDLALLLWSSLALGLGAGAGALRERVVDQDAGPEAAAGWGGPRG